MGVVMKKTSRNDVTGDWLQSKPNNEQFEKNFDLIFRKKKPEYELDDGQLTEEQYAKIKELAEYELNKSTGEVQKVCKCGVKGCE
jgi:hypothetical protein